MRVFVEITVVVEVDPAEFEDDAPGPRDLDDARPGIAEAVAYFGEDDGAGLGDHLFSERGVVELHHITAREVRRP